MRTISTFVTDDSRQLATQLSQLEQNVVAEVADIRKTRELRAFPVDDDPFSPIKTFTVGQCARLDTSATSPVINLSPPADGLPGEVIVVQRVGTTGFFAVGIGALVNGSSAPVSVGAFPYVRVTRFYCDGKDFWF